MTPLVQTKNITKTFPGVTALKDVNFEVLPGEIHALCGENGAGKSTLMKILSGSYSHGSFEGEIFINGEKREFHSPRESSKSGISIVYQELSLVPEMTVAENIFLGREPRKFGVVDHFELIRRSQEILQKLELDISPTEMVSRLPLGTRQLIEIARALSQKPLVLVLDEPTSALSQKECEILFRLVKKLREEGMGVVLVTHKLDEVFGLSNRITVFRDGSKIGTWDTSTLKSDDVIKLMVGREIKDFYPHTERRPGRETLKVSGLTLPHPRFPNLNRLEDINFTLREGEILGFAGLMGSGRSELLLALFGALPFSGSVQVNGANYQPRSPQDAIQAGLQLASEDRKKMGLVLSDTVSKNITLSSLDQVSVAGLLRTSLETKSALKFVESMKVKTPSVHSLVKNLSGGNQQKVVLSKCLMSQPKILFLDEPTRGIDVGAKSEIYHTIHQLAKSGLSVIVVSSELPEVLGLCDRVLVLCEGRITAELLKSEATEEKILRAATQFKRKREVYH